MQRKAEVKEKRHSYKKIRRGKDHDWNTDGKIEIEKGKKMWCDGKWMSLHTQHNLWKVRDGHWRVSGSGDGKWNLSRPACDPSQSNRGIRSLTHDTWYLQCEGRGFYTLTGHNKHVHSHTYTYTHTHTHTQTHSLLWIFKHVHIDITCMCAFRNTQSHPDTSRKKAVSLVFVRGRNWVRKKKRERKTWAGFHMQTQGAAGKEQKPTAESSFSTSRS